MKEKMEDTKRLITSLNLLKENKKGKQWSTKHYTEN